jgi:hypothetical protein
MAGIGEAADGDMATRRSGGDDVGEQPSSRKALR